MDISAFCDKYDMLPHGAIVLAAVSGGKDSMCLLELLLSMSKDYDLKVSCAHFDHRLRGDESTRDRQFVENYCAKRCITCYTGAADVASFASENGLGLEEAARTLRYGFLEETADKIGAERIATAHTANDNAETLLLNFARGAGLRGLCAIPPVRGKIIRPLLETSTAEVFEYLNENKIPHVEDKSNAEDFCARNKLRHRLIPELREISGSFDENAARCISLLREDNEYLEGLAQKFIHEFFDGRSVPAAEFSALDNVISARVLREIVGPGLSAAHIEAVRETAKTADVHASADLPGIRIFREYDRLFFGGVEKGKISPREISEGDCFDIPEAGLRLKCSYLPQCSEIYNSVNIFCFKSDSICGKIILKSRSEGDKIHFLGRNCTKTLKKLFSEAKLNGEARDLIPVLCDDLGVIAVYGFGIAERCAAQPGDNVIRLQIEKISGSK